MAEYTPRERIVRLLLRILNNPHRYTSRELAAYFQVSPGVIKDDAAFLDSLSEINIHYQNYPYKYYIEPNNRYSELDGLHFFTDEEKAEISRALYAQKNSRRAEMLSRKIAGLYDFQQLGLEKLRHPAIERINLLEGAKKDRKVVRLIRYRSNSNSISDRKVEVFNINPELDIIEAYSYKHRETRHFRLSRVERVEVTEDDWQNENHHRYDYADVFRISSRRQEFVQLRLTIKGYNMMTEYFPMSVGKTSPDNTAGFFIFQDKVNADFFGIADFIMGHSEEVEILKPEELLRLIQRRAENLSEKLKKKI